MADTPIMTRAEKRRINRQQLWTVLHDGQGKLGHTFNLFLILLILVSVAILPLEFLDGLEQYKNVLHVTEAIIIGFFTVEYILRIYAAPRRLRYIFSFYGIVDVLSIVPFYVGFFGSQYVRLFRLVRLFKLTEIQAAAQKDDVITMSKDVGLLQGEQVEYVVTKSPVVLMLGSIPPIISITFGVGIFLTFEGAISISTCIVLLSFALIFLWKAWLDFSYDVIYVTNFRLIFQNQHILGRSINQVSYFAVTNVKPHYPNALSFILRYGTLIIDTAAENPGQIGFHTARKHEKASHIIMQKCFEAQTASSQQPSTAPASM